MSDLYDPLSGQSYSAFYSDYSPDDEERQTPEVGTSSGYSGYSGIGDLGYDRLSGQPYSALYPDYERYNYDIAQQKELDDFIKQDNYWADYSNLAAWKARLDTAPSIYADVVDRDKINTAWEILNYFNKGADWTKWDKVLPDTPLYEFLKTIPNPEEAIKQKQTQQAAAQQIAVTPQTPDVYDVLGKTQAGYENLKSWQKAALILTGNVSPIEGRDQASIELSRAMSSVYGALGGMGTAALLVGVLGLLGVSIPAAPVAIAAGIGGAAAAYMSSQGVDVPLFDDAMRIFNIPAELLETVVGANTVAKYMGTKAIMEDVNRSFQQLAQGETPDIYKYGRFTYEVQAPSLIEQMLDAVQAPPEWKDYLYNKLNLGDMNNILALISGDEPAPRGYVWRYSEGIAEPVKIEGKYGEAALLELRKKAESGADLTGLEQDVYKRFADSAVLTDFANQMILDPLNFAPIASNLGISAAAKLTGNEKLAAAARMGRSVSSVLVDALPFGVQQIVSAVTKKQPTMGLIETIGIYKDLLQAGYVPPKYSENINEINFKTLSRFEKGMAGLSPEGEIAELKPRRGILGWFDNLSSTAKANVFLDNMSDNLNVLLHSIAADPTVDDTTKAMKIQDTLNKYAGITPIEVGDAGEAILRNPITATTSAAMAAALEDGSINKYINVFTETRKAAEALKTLANDMEVKPEKLLEDIVRNPQETFDTIKNYLMSKSDIASAEIKNMIEAGILTPDMLKDMFKQFYSDIGKQPVAPFSIEEFVAILNNRIKDKATDWLIKHYEIKEAPGWVRLSNLLKSMMNVVLLDFNEKYPINNLINNLLTRTAAGVAGFSTSGRIDNYFRRMNIDLPSRAAEKGLYTAGVYNMPENKIRQAYMGNGIITQATKRLNDIRSKIGIFSKLSGVIEQAEGKNAVYVGMKRAWAGLWKQDVGFRKLDPVLEGKLKDIDPNLHNRLYKIIESSHSMEEVYSKLSRKMEEGGLDGKYIVNNVIDSVYGEKANVVHDMVAGMGLDDIIDEKLANAKNIDDVKRIFNGIKEQIEGIVDEKIAQELQDISTRITGQVAKGGASNVMEILSDVDAFINEGWIEHYLRLSEGIGEDYQYLSRAERNMRWEEMMREDRRLIDRLKMYEYTMYKSVLDGMNAPKNVTDEIMGLINRRMAYWAEFNNGNGKDFAGKKALYEEYFNKVEKNAFTDDLERSAAWNDIQKTLREYSAKALDGEMEARARLYDAFKDLIKDQEEAKKFSEWADAALNMRREIADAREKFYRELDDPMLTYEEKLQLKYEFWQDYTKAVAKANEITRRIARDIDWKEVKVGSTSYSPEDVDLMGRLKIENMVDLHRQNVQIKYQQNYDVLYSALAGADDELGKLYKTNIYGDDSGRMMRDILSNIVMNVEGKTLEQYNREMPHFILRPDDTTARLFNNEFNQFAGYLWEMTGLDKINKQELFKYIDDNAEYFEAANGGSPDRLKIFIKNASQTDEMTGGDLRKALYKYNLSEVKRTTGTPFINADYNITSRDVKKAIGMQKTDSTFDADINKLVYAFAEHHASKNSNLSIMFSSDNILTRIAKTIDGLAEMGEKFNLKDMLIKMGTTVELNPTTMKFLRNMPEEEMKDLFIKLNIAFLQDAPDEAKKARSAIAAMYNKYADTKLKSRAVMREIDKIISTIDAFTRHSGDAKKYINYEAVSPALDFAYEYIRKKTGGDFTDRIIDKEVKITEAPKIPSQQSKYSNIEMPDIIPEGYLLNEVNRKYIYDFMKACERAAVDELNQLRIGDYKLDTDTQLQLKKYLAMVGEDMSSAKLAAMRVAETWRDNAMLNYKRQSNIDEALNVIFPYQFWYTRTMTNWAKRMIDKPALFAAYAKLRELQRRNEIEGFPTRLEGKFRIPLPFLPDWAGGALYIDPLQQIFPFIQIKSIEDNIYQRLNVQDKKAREYLRELLKNGSITEDEYNNAINKREGYLWEQAKLKSQEELPNDPVSMASMMMDPSIFITILRNMNNPEKIQQLPMTKFGQNLEYTLKGTPLEFLGSIIGGGLAAPERWARDKLNIGQFGEYTDWYISRQIANMVAEGKFAANDAKIALATKSGAIYDEALQRVKYEQAIKTGGVLAVEAAKAGGSVPQIVEAVMLSLFPNGLFPQGELKQRGLQDEYQMAWNKYKAGEKDALSKFLENHPEYEVRLLSYKDPQERLRYFLIDKIWEGWEKQSNLNKQQITESFGDLFKDAFLSKETRDYKAIDLNILAGWARALNAGENTGAEGAISGSIPNYQIDNMLPKQVADELEKYYKERDKKFPNYDLIERLYYDNNRPRTMLEQFKLKEYWEWKRQYKKEHPLIAAYSDLSSGEYDLVRKEVGDLGLVEFRPELARQFFQYLYEGKKMTPGAAAELQRIWNKKGRPGGTFSNYVKMLKNYVIMQGGGKK